MQLVDSSLVTLQTIYLKVGEHEANVATVTQKIQEQIDSDDIVITDSKGQEIIDTQGTQGLSVEWLIDLLLISIVLVSILRIITCMPNQQYFDQHVISNLSYNCMGCSVARNKLFLKFFFRIFP